MATVSLERPQERKRFQIRIQHIITVIILVPVLAHLFFAVSRSPLTDYYVTVDELAAKSAQTSKIRVGAPIAPGTIQWDNASRLLTFKLQGDQKTLQVNYRGFAPDSFRDGATAIVEGELNRDGTFTAYNLLVKCPHQYVPAF